MKIKTSYHPTSVMNEVTLEIETDNPTEFVEALGDVEEMIEQANVRTTSGTPIDLYAKRIGYERKVWFMYSFNGWHSQSKTKVIEMGKELAKKFGTEVFNDILVKDASQDRGMA